VKNHAFAQGNKRTGFAAMVGFLGVNGFRLSMYDDISCANDVYAVLEGRLTENDFIEKLRDVIVQEDVRDWL
jgi:prophage maintenance system killer protein